MNGLICLHPAKSLQHDPTTLRVYCSRCYGSLSSPLPWPLTHGQLESTGVADLLHRIFEELPQDEACVVFDSFMESINRNLLQAQ